MGILAETVINHTLIVAHCGCSRFAGFLRAGVPAERRWHREFRNTPRSVRQGLYPEGLLHSRGTPGIVSRSQPTVWARQFFRRVIGPASPHGPPIADSAPTPARVRCRRFKAPRPSPTVFG